MVTTRPIITRWTQTFTDATCHGCIYLNGTPFRLEVGPEPPLHEHCRCRRLVIPTGSMSTTAFANLVAEADRNGSRAAAIERRARKLLSRD
jgi:hypothetical protein